MLRRASARAPFVVGPMSVPTQRYGGGGWKYRSGLRNCGEIHSPQRRQSAESVREILAFVSQARRCRRWRMKMRMSDAELGEIHSPQRHQGAEGRSEPDIDLVFPSEARSCRLRRIEGPLQINRGCLMWAWGMKATLGAGEPSWLDAALDPGFRTRGRLLTVVSYSSHKHLHGSIGLLHLIFSEYPIHPDRPPTAPDEDRLPP